MISITASILAAIYAGVATVNAAVKSEYWKKGSAYVGANFLSYGGNGWLTGTLGAFETSWVIAYISLGIEIVIFPFIIATEMDKRYAANYAAINNAGDKAQFDWISLAIAFLVAFASWTSAKALTMSTVRLIGYFDITDTDAESAYKTAFSTNPTWDNSIALLIDVSNHTGIISFYYILAGVIANCAYIFALVTVQAQPGN